MNGAHRSSYTVVKVTGIIAVALLAAASCMAADDMSGHSYTGSHHATHMMWNPHGTMMERTARAVAFRNAMRKLWEDHIIFTRQVIVSMAAGLPDTDFAVKRLMQNQEDIGNAIKPLYGDAAGDALTKLLKDHIAGAGDVLVAAKAGDNAKLDAAMKAWYANADDIAVFLNKANPDNWPLDVLKSMMKMHLDTTTQEAVCRLKGDWPGDIAAFEAVHAHILKMADALSIGIIHQFPRSF